MFITYLSFPVDGFFKKRYIQGYMMFFMFFMAFSFRVNLSVAIVAMTERNSENSDFEVRIFKFRGLYNYGIFIVFYIPLYL